MSVVGVGGVGTLERAAEFASHTGVTFTLLWTDGWDVWDHYGMQSTSDFILLDRFGNRVTDAAQPYDPALIESLLADLL